MGDIWPDTERTVEMPAYARATDELSGERRPESEGEVVEPSVGWPRMPDLHRHWAEIEAEAFDHSEYGGSAV